MKVRVTESGPCRRMVHVEVPAADVQPEYSHMLKLYTREAKVDGFRQGKAPAGIVEKRYARMIADDAKDRLIPGFYRKALEQEKIKPVSIVDLTDVVFDKTRGLQFVVMVDIAPDFKLPKYKKIEITSEKVVVTDKDVDAAVEQARQRFARFEDVTGRGVSENDLVRIDYRGEVDGQPVSALSPDCAGLGEGKDFWAIAGEPDFLPGFAKGIVGAEVGVERSLTVNFPADYHVKSVQGKAAAYRVVVKQVRERILPPIDEEFLKRVGEESEAGMRTKIRAALQENAERREVDRKKDEICKYLLDKMDFALPESVLHEETHAAARRLVQRVLMQGATREQIAEKREDIWKAAERSSQDRMRLSYILGRIADEEKLTVSPEDVNARIELMAKDRDVTPERLRAELEEQGDLPWMEDNLRSEKALDHLLENAKVK